MAIFIGNRAVIMTSILLQEEQSLCFLQALGNIHLGQPRITFPSPVRVAGVDGKLSPSITSIR